jgi:diguanylate cyclase (GGDEF)-like protein/PAS domain S-box-containing protein
MSLIAALVYWVIISIWLAVLATVIVAYFRNNKIFGSSRLLLIVLAIDTTRNIIENFYFGLYFGAKYGLFPTSLIGLLGQPNLLIMPKLANVAAASVVLGVLILRWLPMAQREKTQAEADVLEKSNALTREIEEHRRLFETSVDMIVVTDAARVIQRISHSCAAILGYRPEEIVGQHGGKFVCHAHLRTLKTELDLSVQGEALRNFKSDFIHKDGYPVALSWTGVWSERAQRFFLIGRDMREQRAAEEKLKHLAHFDQLTGLPNRTSLLLDIGDVLQPLDGRPQPASLVMFDLDGFKDVNDTLGHSLGDRLLTQVATRMSGAVPTLARIYRLGGDEFVLLLPGSADPMIISKHVDAILHALEVRFEIDGHRIMIGASAGIAMAPADGATPEDLIASADLALYDAKAGGGRKYRLFMPAMKASARARREIEGELRRACAEKEFVLYYQPQIRLADGAVVGAEALLRWRHPERGLLAPAAFIEALAQSPDAVQVGRWILRTACETAMLWQAKGLPLLRMGVNLFPVQFEESILLDDVEAALQTSGLPPDMLEIEITENIALGNGQAVIPSLRALRAKGVGVAFDDFGTGYASLSCLTQYPLTRIKIDRGFVKGIMASASAEDTAVVTSVILMAHNLGLHVIAEGVETATQEAFLRGNACEEAQGFLYSRPVPQDDFEGFLRNRETEIFAEKLAG